MLCALCSPLHTSPRGKQFCALLLQNKPQPVSKLHTMAGESGTFSRISHRIFTSPLLPAALRNRDYYHFHGVPPALLRRWKNILIVSSVGALLSGAVMYETWYQNYHFNKFSYKHENEANRNLLPAYQVKYNRDRVRTWNVEVEWDTIKDNVRGV